MSASLLPVLAAEGGDLLSHVLPSGVTEIAGLEITNHMLMALLAALLLLVVFFWVSARVRVSGATTDAYLTKGRIPQMFEVICVYLRENVARPNLGPLTDKYIGYIWTTFFFILFMNILGLVPIGPIVALITGDAHNSHVAGTATSNLMITGAMALVSLFMIVFVGIREQGAAYFKHFNPGPVWMAPLLVPLEVMGLFIKAVVLAVRLFGNMMAGHLVIAAILSLPIIFQSNVVGVIGVVAGLCLSLLEVFVAFLQAFIFTFLTVLFIAAGAVHHGDDHHDDHGHGEHGLGHGHEARAKEGAPSPVPTH